MGGDGAHGIYQSVEERWEAASQGLMRLMEFCLEALEAAKDTASQDLIVASRHVKAAACYTEAGAMLMRQLGAVVSPSEYAAFRETRDIKGSETDQQIVTVHKKQKISSDYLFNELHRRIANNIKFSLEDPATRSFAESLIALNDAHRIVFGSHKFVCTHVVPDGGQSLRGGNIAVLRNNNLSSFIDDVRSNLKRSTNQLTV